MRALVPAPMLFAFAFACGAAGTAGAADRVQSIPAFEAPLMPSSPALNQLRLDLAAANMKIDAASPLSALVAAIPKAAAIAPVSTTHAAAPVPTDALARLQVAQQLLGHYDPAKFEKLPAAEQDAAFASLWDGWGGRGLLAEGASDPRLGALDALVLEGVRDRELTAANKSAFLGVAVLGYPLQDALWLSRTRIHDAIEDNELRYPEGHRWKTDDGTPEFLGKTPQAQALVDVWSEASAQASAIVRQVRAGSRELPRSSVVSAEASAGFARLAEELRAAGDAEALDYLEKQRDPTFAAFLLDARKPGYYLYNGDGSIVARMLSSKAAAAMGIRRLDQTQFDNVVPSTYYYRPERVVERLQALSDEAAENADKEKTRFAAYARRATGLSVKPKRTPTAPFVFVEPRFVPGSALACAQNDLKTYGEGAAKSLSRYDLPLKLDALRRRVETDDAPPSLDADRWDSLAQLLEACPALAAAGDDAELRLVSQRYQSHDRLVAKTPSGVMIQLFALDELARLRKADGRAAKAFVRFLAAAVDGALR